MTLVLKNHRDELTVSTSDNNMEKTDIEYKNVLVNEVTYVPTKEENVIEFKPEDKVKPSDTLFLYFTVIIGILPMLSIGASATWTSPAMVKLLSNDTNINPLGRPITTSETSVFLGVPSALSLTGTSILPKLADLIGRKRSLQVLCLGMFLSIVIRAFCTSIILLVIFSTFVSTFLCAAWTILPIYITEITEDHNRAKYGCLLSVFYPLGECYCFIVGPAFSLKDFTIITALPMLPFLLLFFFAPESPVYSLKKGREEECIQALRKLRSNKTSEDLESDLNEIRKDLTAGEQTKGVNFTKLFTSRECRIAVLLGSLPMHWQILCGVPVIMSLLAPIFDESGSNLSGNTIAIIVGVVKTISFIFTSLIIENAGRKLMLVISNIGTGVSVSVLGVFFYLQYIRSPIVSQFQWVPLASILICIITFSVGIGPIPTVIIGELFTSELRTSAYAFISTSAAVVFIFQAAGYPFVAAGIGIHWCMWIFGGSCFIGGFLMHRMLPETKGKSLVEIQEILKKY